MKNKIIAITLLLCSFPVFAASTTATTSQTQTQSSTSAASTDGNQQAINIAASVIPTSTTQNVDYSGTQTVKNVPSVSGPNLTTSNDTCMGSSSGSANGPGFGVSIGSTWTDKNCVILKNSRELWNMGMKAASLALMCKDADNKEALELTGYICPQTTKNKQVATTQVTQPVQSAAYVGNDPIIRQRLGLAPLASN